MKFKVKDLDIATEGPLVVVLNQKDAQLLDLHAADRVLLRFNKKKTVAIVDIAESKKSVKQGWLGCFEEIIDKLGITQGDEIRLDYAHKPRSIKFIKKKLKGKALDTKEIDTVVKDVVRDELSEGELTYFVSACYMHGLSLKETVDLTTAIVNHGKTLGLRNKMIVDKHCTGGVPGNRTTMLVVPIVAAAGLVMPKTSSRSITSPAGTADTMEVLCEVTLPVQKIGKIVRKLGACITWGGGVNLASADDKLIRVRHPLSIDPEGMMVASILAKKKAVGAKHVLVDIPVGKDTKVKTRTHANKLKKLFVSVGKKIGMNVHVLITDGEQPIGRGIGPALEARDVLWVLQQHPCRPMDLEKKSLMLAAKLMDIAGIKDAKKKATEILASGKAYEKFKQIIKAQGGDPNVDPMKIQVGKIQHRIRAPKNGTIIDLDTAIIAKIGRMAGAPLDKRAGVFVHQYEGTKVKKGQPIMTIYASTKANLHFAKMTYHREGGITIK